MLPSFVSPAVALGALFVTSSLAGPVDVRSDGLAMDLAAQERLPSINLGSYSLVTAHENDVLFDVVAATGGNSARLKVECIDCRTWGTAVITTSGVNKNEDIIGDIVEFFKDPVDTIMDAFDLDVKISFDDCGGYFEFDILAIDTMTYSIPIFSSGITSGIACSEEVTLGLGVFVDLVFSLSAEIDLSAGFEVAFPEGAYITVDPLSGDIVDHSFSGGSVQHLPVEVRSGSAIFRAALRVRVQAGTTVEVFGTGFDFELGVSADLIEYEASLASTSDCDLAITESIDVNIGAYAHAVVEIDYKTFGVAPAVVTTILDVALPSLCLVRDIEPTGTIYTAPAETMSLAESSIIGSVSAAPSTTPIAVTAIATSTSSSAVFSSTGAIFYQSSGSVTATPTSRYSNSTITTAPSLVTSTVYSTDLVTVTSCAANVIHCPANQASEVVITSTTVLYTTVCPAGQIQPSFTLSTTSSSSATSVPTAAITQGFSLTPCKTPAVSTVYAPTFVVPTYTMPTATTFTIPYPNWNSTTSTIGGYVSPTGAAKAVDITASASVPPPSSPSKMPSYTSNSTTSTSGTPFTNAAIRPEALPKGFQLAAWFMLALCFLG
ncbi:hypothetical protein B7463_g11961, partial [Scytalidium lignicola]